MSRSTDASGPQFRADRPLEQEAVRTTIVGGRPPGSGQPVGAIPRGIEVLVKKASVDPQFREVLLEERAAAAGRIGLELQPAEALMLAAVPREQLEAIIARTTVPTEHRRAFLGQAAAAMVAALGVLAAGREAVAQGARPDPPPPPPIGGVQPDRPTNTGVGTFGMQPDRPPGAPAPEPDTQQDKEAENRVAREVRQIIARQLKIDPEEVTDEKSLIGDLEADPAALLRLRREVEKAFGIKIPHTALKKMRTVGQTTHYVEEAVKARDKEATGPAQPFRSPDNLPPSRLQPSKPIWGSAGMRPR